jgi:hypothetical protein
MRTLATNWEAEVAAVRNDNLELHSLLQGAQAQQSQAEERASAAQQKAKVAALAIAEDRLLQERAARKGAEGQLQQEQAALADARSVLEQECVAREAAQKSLEGRNAEFSKLEGELVVLSITSASQELALQEQSETVNGLQQAVEAERRALEVERKQVEGRFAPFSDPPLAGNFQACTPRWGTRPSVPRLCRPPTTPPSRSCWSCALRPSRPVRPWRRARRRLGARWPAACAPSAGTSPGACAGRCTSASRRP